MARTPRGSGSTGRGKAKLKSEPGENLTGEEIKPNAEERRLDSTGLRPFVFCSRTTGRPMLHAGNPFRDLSPQAAAANNRNHADTDLFYREPTPFDRIYVALKDNPAVREAVLTLDSVQVLEVVFRNSGSAKIDGRRGYVIRQGTAVDAAFLDWQEATLLGDDARGWTGYPSKTEFDVDKDVTEKFRAFSRVPFGEQQTSLLAA